MRVATLSAELRASRLHTARARLAVARAELATAQGALEGVDDWLADRLQHTVHRVDEHLRRVREGAPGLPRGFLDR
jgi:hypothetical protein